MKATKKDLTLEWMKNEMKYYTDFYGAAINTQKINEAKSKLDLYNILDEHQDFITDMHSDALGHLGRFKKRIGLNIEPEDDCE